MYNDYQDVRMISATRHADAPPPREPEPKRSRFDRESTPLKSTNVDRSGFAAPEESTRQDEDPYLREELEDAWLRNVPFYGFLDVLFKEWRNTTAMSPARALANPAFVDAMRQYSAAVERNRVKRTAILEATLYQPFTDMVNAILKEDRLPYRYISTFAQKIPNLEHWKRDPDRKPDGVLVYHGDENAETDIKKLNWAHVLVVFEFKASKATLSSRPAVSLPPDEADILEDPDYVQPPRRDRKRGADPNGSKDSRPSGTRLRGPRAPKSKGRKRGTSAPRSSRGEPMSRRDRGAKENPVGKTITLKPDEQLASYAMEMMYPFGIRRHCLGVYINNDALELWYFDRAGPIGSQLIPFASDYSVLVTLISALARADMPTLGFEPHIHVGGNYWNPNSKTTYVELDGIRFYIDPCKLNSGHHLVGLGTSVWKCTMIENDTSNETKSVALKLSWVDPRRGSEVDVLESARMKGIEQGILNVIAHSDLDRLSLGFRGRLQTMVPGRNLDITGNERVLRAIVFELVCVPLYSIKEAPVFMRSFLSIVTTHRRLYEAGILHRNINVQNLMYDEKHDQGVLVDFNLAIQDSDEPLARTEYRVLSTPFMALELCQTGYRRHLYRHDLESFFWYLYWICHHYEEGHRIRDSTTREWGQGIWGKISNHKLGILHGTYEDLTAGYIELQPCLTALADMFIAGRSAQEEDRNIDEEDMGGRVIYERFAEIVSQYI